MFPPELRSDVDKREAQLDGPDPDPSPRVEGEPKEGPTLREEEATRGDDESRFAMDFGMSSQRIFESNVHIEISILL